MVLYGCRDQNQIVSIMLGTSELSKDFIFHVYYSASRNDDRYLNYCHTTHDFHDIDQRHRDVIGDTALLSAFVTLQTYANDLEQLHIHVNQQRHYFETLQEKLTWLRDAR
jgi:hypothetical protein